MSILNIAKHLGVSHNVSFRVLDRITGQVVQEHTGHNAATNSLLLGIGHYLKGDGVLNQGYSMLSSYVPKYISLGTMGLINQNEDENGLPVGIGTPDTANSSEADRFTSYMQQRPGFGSDGYDENDMNGRLHAGLGPSFGKLVDENKSTGRIVLPVDCELISPSFPRAAISFRDVVPSVQAELPRNIDVVFSAIVSTGALAQFRQTDKNYIFITEAGLWSRKDWIDGGCNGLLAGYRIAPHDEANWDMTDANNREMLKRSIIRVGINQVVQVVWKIQLGSIDDLNSLESDTPGTSGLYWNKY